MNTRRAPAVVLAFTKGGVGKATVAFRLATALARRLPLARAGLPAVRDAQVTAGLVVIDLEGPANQAMLYACGKEDLVLVPAQPSRFDVVEAMKAAGVVRQAADRIGRGMAHRALLTRTPVLRQNGAGRLPQASAPPRRGRVRGGLRRRRRSRRPSRRRAASGRGPRPSPGAARRPRCSCRSRRVRRCP